MADVSVVGPDGGEPIQLGPVLMRILEAEHHGAPPRNEGDLTIPPAHRRPPQHRRARHDEGFYVVAGTARFTVGEQATTPARAPW